MSDRRSSPMLIVRPFRVDFPSSNVRRSSRSSADRNPLISKLNEFVNENQRTTSNSSSMKNQFPAMSERDEHDQKIIRRFVSASNEVEARQILCQMWKESRFCDLMLVVDGSEYLAHRVVLAAFSQKYRSIFREREKDFVVRTHLRRSSHKSLQIVLNFLYTGEITLTFRNINEVLSCARELGLEKIFEIGEEFLLNFDKRHVFRVLELSKRFGLKNSFRRSHVFLSSNFNQCVNMKQFLQLSMKTLVEILSDDTIRNRDESMLLGRILNWITTNHIDNNQVIVSLFEQIRWNQLDYQQKREWFTATQELADNAKLTSFIREQISLAYEKSKSPSRADDSATEEVRRRS